MRTFKLHRSEDVTGISGTGDVAEGVMFNSGKVVVAWDPFATKAKVVSIVVFDDIADVRKLHGHDGKTEIVWEDAG